MSQRTTLQHAWMTARIGAGSRATAREFDDDHLIQQIKKADVFRSETPSNFERFQQCGVTCVPLKQEEEQEQGQQGQKSGGGSQGGQGQAWDDNQPKGPAAEVVMNYLNGSRSHPVAAVTDDRRVRPYGMSEGEGALYAPDGSEQMVLFKEDFTRVMSLDNVSVKDKKNKKTRFVSLAHVEKEMQTHKIDDDQQQGQGGQQQQKKKEKYKHEGKSVNMEVRVTASRIEFRDGDSVVGYYDKSGKKWWFKGTTVEHESETMTQTVSKRFETVGKTYLGLDGKGESPPLGEKGDVDYKQTYVKLKG